MTPAANLSGDPSEPSVPVEQQLQELQMPSAASPPGAGEMNAAYKVSTPFGTLIVA